MRTSNFAGRQVNRFNLPVAAITSAVILVALSASVRAGTSSETAAPAAITGEWSKTADQGASFQMAGNRMVRYGAGTTWVKKRLVGTVVCDTSTFGSDPAPGLTKTCETKLVALAPAVATLTWTASSDPEVVGYRIYYGTTSNNYLQAPGTGVSAGKQTVFSVGGLPANTTYYFAVTSVDATGKESTFSNEAYKRIE